MPATEGTRTMRLSVVIPVRDDAPALRRCLAALDAQTTPAWEVVVVDNGSTDDSAAVARERGARVVPEPVRGIPAAAATGYDAARGDVVVRCDADTVPPPGFLARVESAFAADPELDAITGTGTFYDVGPLRAAVVGPLYLGAYYLLMHAAMAHPPLWGSAMALRREAWLRARPLVHRDPELHDDVDLAFALGPRARIRYDRGLRVRVSGRSLVGAAQTRRRFTRAFRTLRLSWARTPPWERWRTRLSPSRPAVPRDGGPTG